MTRAAHRGLRDLRGAAPLVWFYLATPVFALIDAAGWGPLRAAGIEDGSVRAAYYAALFLLGLWARARPAAAAPIAVVEGSTNLVLLFLSVLGPIWGLLEVPDDANAVVEGLPARIVNLVLVGSVVVLGIRRSIGSVAGTRARGRRP
ncbi:MAG: hypothetical protein KJO11_01160 [Gemmatimonadetes bacterium]|nr:hypothetical protein [Gemmatimonadota bacterium]